MSQKNKSEVFFQLRRRYRRPCGKYRSPSPARWVELLGYDCKIAMGVLGRKRKPTALLAQPDRFHDRLTIQRQRFGIFATIEVIARLRQISHTKRSFGGMYRRFWRSGIVCRIDDTLADGSAAIARRLRIRTFVEVQIHACSTLCGLE